MRIISGSARGRKLKEPSSLSIRPTSDMVKESVFNIVQFDLEGRRVLDLFAGTGQLGIEALSRGAKSAVFVDSKPEALKLIRENLKLSGFSDSASVYAGDAMKYLAGDSRRKNERFDIVFIDPPYDAGLTGNALFKIIEFDKLNPNGIIICELKAECVAPEVAPPYHIKKEYRYGSVKIIRIERSA